MVDVEDVSGPMRMPVGAFLVQHPKGSLVFDTGMHPELLTSKDRLRKVGPMFDIHLGDDDLVDAQLRAHDVDPDELDLAVVSHLHFDHGGGLCRLPGARVLVQRAEWEAAQDEKAIAIGVYEPTDFDLGHDKVLLDGEHDVFGDGSVRILPTPGHTPGHQSLLIEGRLLLVGDACYCRLALDRDALPMFSADPDRQLATFAWLREQEAAGVELVFSHDPDQWAALPPVL
jgi:glyoxylase-like metal-dependent hydrolase (beta-lactamase superfamily II)